MAAACIAFVLICSVVVVTSQNDKYGRISWDPSAIYFPQDANRRSERSGSSQNLMSITYPEHSAHDSKHEDEEQEQEEEKEEEEVEGKNLGDWSISELELFARLWLSRRKPGMMHSRQLNLHGSDDVGSRCKLPNGYSSKCTTITDCPGALHDLVKRNIKPVRCGFKGRVEVVCCPDLAADNYKPKPDAWQWEGPNFNGPSLGEGPYNNRPTPGNGRPTQGSISNKPTPGVGTPKPLGVTKLPVRSNIGQKSESACQRYGKNAFPRVGLYIKGGVEAQLTEFPHMVLLGYPDDGSTKYRQSKLKNGTVVTWRCGGTLISEQFVLTAAHCVARFGSLEPFVVRVGDLDWSTDEDGAVPEDVSIANIKLHPDYSYPIVYHDVALLKLAKPVTLTPAVQPACLPQPQVHTADYYDGRPLIITGWGDSELAMDKASPVLMKADVTGVSLTTCNQSYSNAGRLPRGVINVGQLCAQDLKEQSDACSGDSGGPLQEAMPKPSPLYRVVGVTSVGRSCSGRTPTLYARVVDYISWIESEVWP